MPPPSATMLANSVAVPPPSGHREAGPAPRGREATADRGILLAPQFKLKKSSRDLQTQAQPKIKHQSSSIKLKEAQPSSKKLK
jgi:hypothetical protein